MINQPSQSGQQLRLLLPDLLYLLMIVQMSDVRSLIPMLAVYRSLVINQPSQSGQQLRLLLPDLLYLLMIVQ